MCRAQGSLLLKHWSTMQYETDRNWSWIEFSGPLPQRRRAKALYPTRECEDQIGTCFPQISKNMSRVSGLRDHLKIDWSLKKTKSFRFSFDPLPPPKRLKNTEVWLHIIFPLKSLRHRRYIFSNLSAKTLPYFVPFRQPAIFLVQQHFCLYAAIWLAYHLPCISHFKEHTACISWNSSQNPSCCVIDNSVSQSENREE